MIPDRKWSPYSTTNDPDQKIRNGMDGGILSKIMISAIYATYPPLINIDISVL